MAEDIRGQARLTAVTRAPYNRIPPMYDAMEAYTERSAFGAWRQELWVAVPASRVLEVGVGTGRNLSFYPPGAQMTAIDLSDRILARARQRAASVIAEVKRPKCGSDRVRRKVPTFASKVSGGGNAVAPASSCAPGGTWGIRR